MDLNVKLLDQIIDKIEETPEQHKQAVFGERTACGTSHCVAGWALVLSPEAVEGEHYEWEAQGNLEGYSARWMMIPGEDKPELEDQAADLLGISRDQGYSLFFDFGETEHILGRLRELKETGEILVKYSHG